MDLLKEAQLAEEETSKGGAKRANSLAMWTSSSPEPVRLAGREWLYRGEGGANLVISIPEERTVVRFAKSKYAGKDQVRGRAERETR